MSCHFKNHQEFSREFEVCKGSWILGVTCNDSGDSPEETGREGGSVHLKDGEQE